MLQNLLAERFALRLHREPGEMDVYELRIARGGPKLKESGPALPVTDPDQPQQSGGFQPHTGVPSGRVTNPSGSRFNMGSFAKFLEQVGCPVFDKTGLTGTYDINMEYSGGRPGGGSALTDDPDATPGLATAVQHLSLKIVPGKAPITVLVVDQANKTPAAN